MTRYVNAWKISISLLCCQLSNQDPIIDYNITNLLDLPLDNNKKDIIPKLLNNSDLKEIKLVDISNNEKNIKPIDINK